MNEKQLLAMLNIILDNIDIAERNQFTRNAIDALYKAKDAINAELKALSY